MKPLVEMLETRTLLSGNPANVNSDIAAYKSACATTLSDLSSGEATFHKDFNPIVADLQRLGANHANAALLNSLNQDGLGSLAKLKADVQKLTSRGLSDMHLIVRADNRLFRQPGNQTLLVRLESAINQFRSDASSLESKIFIDASNADNLEDKDLNAIASANSGDAQTQTDVATAKSDSKSVGTTAESDLGSVGSTGATLISDVS